MLSKRLPSTLLAFISIKPSPFEWDNREAIVQTNALIRELVSPMDNVTYLDVFERMLGPDGSCRPDFFQADGVHMAPAGYEVWREVVMSYLTGRGAGFHRQQHGGSVLT